jgi:uncharacterized protein YegP (UPF0339 family)
MGKFVISKRSNGEFQFNLKADNGEVILTSEGYSTKANCLNGADSVRENSQNDKMYESKVSANNKYYFVLKAANNQIIGTSQMYENTTGMDSGIASVMKNAPDAAVDDTTG